MMLSQEHIEETLASLDYILATQEHIEETLANLDYILAFQEHIEGVVCEGVCTEGPRQNTLTDAMPRVVEVA